MRRSLLLLFLPLVAPAPAAVAGDIVGTVAARGPEEAPDADDGAYQSYRFKFAEKVDYDHLRDFVIYVDQPVAGGAPPAHPLPVITQRNASFEPHVLAVAVGTTVHWPNRDNIFHNVFSMSDAKEFDLGFYDNGASKDVTFDAPGQVDVYCSIHSKMHCIVLVVPNPFFAMADAHRRFRISGLPAGTYRVKAWHERLPSQAATVTVPAEGEARCDFTLGLSALPKY